MLSKKPAIVNKQFTFKIKTQSGTVATVEKDGPNLPEAVKKLRKQYPDCVIIDAHHH